jgi:hypothetical protein
MTIWNTTDARLQVHNGTSWSAGFVRLDGDTMTSSLIATSFEARNATNPTNLILNNTRTDASNYERSFFRWVSNVCRIGTEALGTGASRQLQFEVGGVARLTIGTDGSVSTQSATAIGTTLQIGPSGNILRTSSSRLEVRDSANSTFGTLAALSVVTSPAGFGSVATPVYSNVELRFGSATNLAGMVRGRGRASNLSYGDVIISANPAVTTIDGSNLTDDVLIRGDTGSVNINRGLLFCCSFTVANLPSAASNAGGEAVVTDSTTTTHGATVSGGGANRVKVFSNGTNWLVN